MITLDSQWRAYRAHRAVMAAPAAASHRDAFLAGAAAALQACGGRGGADRCWRELMAYARRESAGDLAAEHGLRRAEPVGDFKAS